MSLDKGRKTVKIRIHRFNPETGKRWIQEYEIPLVKGMTVLDALLYIKEHLDHTLVFRYSCRMGVCGSCGVLVNGTPRLACQTQVSQVAGNNVVELAPLPGYPVIRDLLVDMSRLFENHKKIRPYIIRRNMDEVEKGPREFIVLPEEHLDIYQFTLCIMCGLCNAACPVFNSNPRYLGPQALTQAYRFIVDVRDEAYKERIVQVASPDGCFGCHFAASCSAVCPKAVDPAGAIQRLRSIVLKSSIGLWRKHVTKIAPPLEKPLRKVEARYPTENLVEGADPEAESRKPVPSIIDPENPPP